MRRWLRPKHRETAGVLEEHRPGVDPERGSGAREFPRLWDRGRAWPAPAENCDPADENAQGEFVREQTGAPNLQQHLASAIVRNRVRRKLAVREGGSTSAGGLHLRKSRCRPRRGKQFDDS